LDDIITTTILAVVVIIVKISLSKSSGKDEDLRFKNR